MGALKQILLLAATLGAAFGPSPGLAREMDDATLRAAFLYNFAQFVTWPTEQGHQFRICSHGQDELGSALDALEGRRVRHMSIVVRRGVPLSRLADCQLVYLAGGEREALGALLKATANQPQLVVADIEAGAQLGAGVALVPLDDSRLGFQLNLDSMQRSHLTPSSRLIKLARRVY